MILRGTLLASGLFAFGLVAQAQVAGFKVGLTTPTVEGPIDCTNVDITGTYAIPASTVPFEIQINGVRAARASGGQYSLLDQQFAEEGLKTFEVKIFDKRKSPMVLAASTKLSVDCVSAYKVDSLNHTIDVTALVGSPNVTIAKVVQILNARPDKSVRWMVRFDNRADYIVDRTVTFDEMRNVHLWSDMNHPAKFIKNAANQANIEYLWRCLHCEDVTIQGFRFEGWTTEFDPFNYNWVDQGVFLPSTKRVTVVNNGFFNIGNAALRVTTYWADPINADFPPINCIDNVVTNNLFKNVQQVTTTSDGPAGHINHGHGGCRGLAVTNNVFRDLQGALKFASRVPGTGDITVTGNRFLHSEHLGIDVSGYDGITISDNYFEDISTNMVSLYTNQNADEVFDWGNNIVVQNNTGVRVGGGVYFGNSPYLRTVDGVQVKVQKKAGPFLLAGNVVQTLVQNVKIPTKDPVLGNIMKDDLLPFFNGTNLTGVTVRDNKIYDVAAPRYLIKFNSSTGVSVSGNTVDDVAYTP
jgi:hypothetical protein